MLWIMAMAPDLPFEEKELARVEAPASNQVVILHYTPTISRPPA
ncbi:hypothetical protein [Labrys miyagiensis]|nr:hypothetical protein [Labrys miyagiensis]